jgi:hypothetical protein
MDKDESAFAREHEGNSDPRDKYPKPPFKKQKQP